MRRPVFSWASSSFCFPFEKNIRNYMKLTKKIVAISLLRYMLYGGKGIANNDLLNATEILQKLF